MIFIASLVLLLIIKLLFPKGKSIHRISYIYYVQNFKQTNFYATNFIPNLFVFEILGKRYKKHKLTKPNIYILLHIYFLSERVGKLLKNHNIVLSNKSTNSLRNQLCNLKDKRAKEEI